MPATFCALEPEGNRDRFPSVRPHGGFMPSGAPTMREQGSFMPSGAPTKKGPANAGPFFSS